MSQAGEAYQPEAETTTGTEVGFLGLKRWTRNDRKLDLASRHLSILGLLLMLALSLTIWSAFQAILRGADVSALTLTGPWTWAAIFGASLTGAMLNRMVAVSFTGFKFKRYHPLTFPHRLTQAIRAPFIATSLIALGAVSLTQGDGWSALTLTATAFALGYFGDMAFERFRDLVRTMLGLAKDSDKPEIARVHGIDVPLRALTLENDRLPPDLQDLPDHVATLRNAGFEYGHDLIEHWHTPEGREAIKARTNLPDETIERTVQLLDVARTGAPIPLAAQLLEHGIRSGQAVATCDDDLVQTAIEELPDGLSLPASDLRRNATTLLDPS